MNTIVEAYFASLGLTDALSDRFATLVALHERITQTPVEDVFASEYVSDEIGRVFESLWLFSGDLAMEAQTSIEDGDRFDLVPVRRSVRHWIVEMRDFDLVTATENSRMSMEVWLADNRVGTLRASGANCEQLFRIGAERIRPNLAPLASSID